MELESLDDTLATLFPSTQKREVEKWVIDMLDELCYDLEREKYLDQQEILVENCAHNLSFGNEWQNVLPLKKRLHRKGYAYLETKIFGALHRLIGK